MKTSYWDNFDKDDVLPNELYTFDPTFDVQKFFEYRSSFLKDFIVDGKLYSQYLTEACKAVNQNQKITLVNLQKEQSIVTMPTLPPSRTLDRALGFGMTDDGDHPENYGFKLQNDLAISWYDRHYQKFKDITPQPKELVDVSAKFNMKGFRLEPKNVMTFMAYHYTPWTGSPDSLFYTGFWFDNTHKTVLDPSILLDNLGSMVDGTVNPSSNPFHFDTDKKKLSNSYEYARNEDLKRTVVLGPINNPSAPVIQNIIEVYRQKPWKSHGVYLFWTTWKYFWPDDLKQYNHIEEV